MRRGRPPGAPFRSRFRRGRLTVEACAPRLDSGSRAATLTLVAALHAGLLFALLLMPSVRERLALAPPMFVSFVDEARAPRVEPPRPLPRPALRDPMPVRVPMPPIAIAPEVSVAPAPTAAAIALPVAMPQPSAAQPAMATAPPRFDMAYLNNPAPAYPSLSRRLREKGRVVLRVLVNATGSAEAVEVGSSSGSERLDHAAIDAVRRWRFVPAHRGAEAIAAWAMVPILFELDT
jgi:protein TonB